MCHIYIGKVINLEYENLDQFNLELMFNLVGCVGCGVKWGGRCACKECVRGVSGLVEVGRGYRPIQGMLCHREFKIKLFENVLLDLTGCSHLNQSLCVRHVKLKLPHRPQKQQKQPKGPQKCAYVLSGPHFTKNQSLEKSFYMFYNIFST